MQKRKFHRAVQRFNSTRVCTRERAAVKVFADFLSQAFSRYPDAALILAGAMWRRDDTDTALFLFRRLLERSTVAFD